MVCYQPKALNGPEHLAGSLTLGLEPLDDTTTSDDGPHLSTWNLHRRSKPSFTALQTGTFTDAAVTSAIAVVISTIDWPMSLVIAFAVLVGGALHSLQD
jgi:hypothetical protein